VDAARGAVSKGAGDRALELLRQYQDRYPAGSFHPEVAALRVDALMKLGRSAEARAAAERFVAEFGRGPLADRVLRVAGLAQP
jgi:outer membrane protein assembly factor BamD (BamD/ComL family)